MTEFTNGWNQGEGRAAATVVTTLICGILAGCSSGGGLSTAPPGGSTTLVGVVADATESGVLTVTIATGALAAVSPIESQVPVIRLVTPAYANAASVVNATGTLAIQGGATVTLSGTYDTGAHTLSLSGSGYAFTGTYSNGVLSGTFTNPQGSSGGFTTQAGSTTSVIAYCGTFTGEVPGWWMVAISFASNTVTGLVVDKAGERGSITGTVSGSSLSGAYASYDPSGTQTGHGTWNGALSGANQSALSGTWTNTATGETGTFSGARCP